MEPNSKLLRLLAVHQKWSYDC